MQEGSTLRLLVNETLANVRLPSDAVLETPKLTGQLVIGSDGAIGPESKFIVDLSTLKSDDSDRDDNIKENFLETAKFRDGVFVPKEPRGLPNPVPASGPVKGQLAGDLTIHGVTRPVVFDVDGQLDGSSFKGTARTEVKITEFGMKVPSFTFLLRVEDRVRAEIVLIAKANG